MLAKVCSAAVSGIEAYPVEVEVNAGYGDTLIVIVGLPDTAVKESRDRVMTALINSGFKFTFGRTTINLAPADVKKEGPSFDLPIAVGMVAASEQLETDQLENFVMVGELALTGAVRPVKGVLPIALRARAEGKVGMLVPPENAAEAAVVAGLQVIPIQNLREAVSFLEGEVKIAPVKVDIARVFDQPPDGELDFADVKGQESVKRALEIAAAGGHIQSLEHHPFLFLSLQMTKHPLFVGWVGSGLHQPDMFEVRPIEQIGELDQPTTIGQRAIILAIAFQHVEGIEQVAYTLAIQDKVARDDGDGLEYRLRQPDQQALAIDAVDFSARLTDQNTAAIKLLLHRKSRIFQQALCFRLVDRVEQLGEKASDTIFLRGVLIGCAIRSFGVTLGHFLPDQLVVDALGRVKIHRRLGFGAGAHRRSSATKGEVNDE